MSLSETADEMEAAAESLHARGLFEEASKLWRAARDIRRHLKGLTAGEHSPKVRSMDAEHREAISKSKTKDSPLMRAARKKGFLTQKEVAEAIGMKANFLSAIVKGAKKMPPESAELLFKKTGYRWPS